ncbi:hypothetical protein L6452_17232 [Arctium lappa]|uniref:Uncharacterized protein n=1 Tax=Arctium lappa TaxID=4217 RepID=A0ACB9C2T7_ARCLA|nr:hypothetical protein L6452_17232 [Arctium lappa]
MENRLSGSVMSIPISTTGLLLSKPYEPHFPHSTSKIKGIERKDCFSVRIRSHGILFMTTERLGFCSEKSLQTYSTTGELLKFQYMVSIPLEKIKGVGESMNSKKPSKKFVELATMDDFSFWFMGFPHYKRTLRHLHRTIMSLVPKLIEIIKQKLSYGAKILPLGHEAKIFTKSFSTRDSEKLLKASRCHIYTTAGAIAGILFMTTERLGFCSEKSLQTYSTTGELLKIQYKVSIPLEKIKGVGESMNSKRLSNKYVELVTMDDYSSGLWAFRITREL